MDGRRIVPVLFFVVLCLVVLWSVEQFAGNETQSVWLGPPLGRFAQFGFGFVWTTLFVLTGVAAGLIWNSRHRGRFLALGFLASQLCLVVAWSIAWSRVSWWGAGLIMTPLLLAAMVATVIPFLRISRMAGGLLLLNLVWVLIVLTVDGAVLSTLDMNQTQH